MVVDFSCILKEPLGYRGWVQFFGGGGSGQVDLWGGGWNCGLDEKKNSRF